MNKPLYVLYTPFQGDGDMWGPYHDLREANQNGANMKEKIQSGEWEKGEVKIIDENCHTVRLVYKSEEGKEA
jgi:hypothetical protein